MCGIFAFTGTHPDAGMLAAVINGASRRGPHGHGWAVITDASTRIRRHLGRLDAYTTDAVTDASGLSGTLLGHARMATVGAWDNKDNLQPIAAGNITVAHNGVITNPDALYPNAPTDSIALTRAYRIMRNNNFTPVQAIEKIIATADQQAWALVIADDGHVYAHRNRHPLYVVEQPEGMYMSSHRFHPHAVPVPENQIARWGTR